MDIITSLETPQGTNFLAGLAVTNPGLYMFMKHWSKILLVFFTLVILVGGAGAWKYNQYLSNKIDRINNELVDYKNKYQTLSDSYIFLQNEILITKNRIEDFNKEVNSIKRDNAALRERISLVSKGNTISDTQTNLDNLRKDLNDKWQIR